VAGSPLDTDGAWQHHSFDWNSGTNVGATIKFVDLNTSVPFDDFAIDDLTFRY
jgi:hypothetical protein